jgi:hypothetical protein
MSDNSRRPLIFVEQEQGIHGAAELERTDSLEILALEEHSGPGPLIERPRGQHGGAMRPGLQPFGSLKNVVEADRDGRQIGWI